AAPDAGLLVGPGVVVEVAPVGVSRECLGAGQFPCRHDRGGAYKLAPVLVTMVTSACNCLSLALFSKASMRCHGRPEHLRNRRNPPKASRWQRRRVSPMD